MLRFRYLAENLKKQKASNSENSEKTEEKPVEQEN